MSQALLIVGPRLSMPGGVANFYRTILPHLAGTAEYVEVGAARDAEGALGRVHRLVRDYWIVHRRLSTNRFGVTIINPSLGPKALPRDAVIIWLSLLHRVPTVVFFRGWDERTEKVVRRWFSALFRLSYLRATAFVVLGERFRRKLREMGYEGPVFRSSTAVDDRIFDCPDTYLASRKGNTILFLGRIERAKGIFETLDAFAQIQTPTTKLVFAGDGPDAPELRLHAQAMGLTNVEFLGHIDGTIKQRVIAEADIFVLLSYSEGMPNSVLEAMSYGLPVITTNTGGLVDFFRDKEMGYMLQSPTADQCAKHMSELLKDHGLRSRMGTFNREYARQHFKASAVAAELRAIVHGLSSGEP